MLSDIPLTSGQDIVEYKPVLETNSLTEAYRYLKNKDTATGYPTELDIPHSLNKEGFIDFSNTFSHIKVRCIYDALEAEMSQLFGCKEGFKL
jgi:hypothetical protein